MEGLQLRWDPKLRLQSHRQTRGVAGQGLCIPQRRLQLFSLLTESSQALRRRRAVDKHHTRDRHGKTHEPLLDRDVTSSAVPRPGGPLLRAALPSETVRTLSPVTTISRDSTPSNADGDARRSARPPPAQPPCKSTANLRSSRRLRPVARTALSAPRVSHSCTGASRPAPSCTSAMPPCSGSRPGGPSRAAAACAAQEAALEAARSGRNAARPCALPVDHARQALSAPCLPPGLSLPSEKEGSCERRGLRTRWACRRPPTRSTRPPWPS